MAMALPARSIWDKSQPPKISPCALANTGIAIVRSASSDSGEDLDPFRTPIEADPHAQYWALLGFAYYSIVGTLLYGRYDSAGCACERDLPKTPPTRRMPHAFRYPR